MKPQKGTLSIAACQTQDAYTGEQQTSKATYGAVGGALLGALAGGLIGKGDANDRRQRALIGAGVGALAGGGVGYYMDKHSK